MDFSLRASVTMPMVMSWTEAVAQATLRFLQHRPGWKTATGLFAARGPFEDRIDPVAVRAVGEGAASEVEVVFEHRAFHGRLFGLRSGPLRPDESDPDEVGVEFGSWAEDFPFLYGLEAVAPVSSGVVWLRPR